MNDRGSAGARDDSGVPRHGSGRAQPDAALSRPPVVQMRRHATTPAPRRRKLRPPDGAASYGVCLARTPGFGQPEAEVAVLLKAGTRRRPRRDGVRSPNAVGPGIDGEVNYPNWRRASVAAGAAASSPARQQHGHRSPVLFVRLPMLGHEIAFLELDRQEDVYGGGCSEHQVRQRHGGSHPEREQEARGYSGWRT